MPDVQREIDDLMRELYLQDVNQVPNVLTDTKSEFKSCVDQLKRVEKSGIIVAEALQVLNMDQEADEARVQNAYHQLAVKKHPDKGGNTEEFQCLFMQYRMTCIRQVRNISE